MGFPNSPEFLPIDGQIIPDGGRVQAETIPDGGRIHQDIVSILETLDQ